MYLPCGCLLTDQKDGGNPTCTSNHVYDPDRDSRDKCCGVHYPGANQHTSALLGHRRGVNETVHFPTNIGSVHGMTGPHVSSRYTCFMAHSQGLPSIFTHPAVEELVDRGRPPCRVVLSASGETIVTAPVAVAYPDDLRDQTAEIIFDGDIIWGSIHALYGPFSIRWMHKRNKRKIASLLMVCMPTLNVDLWANIAGYLHHHFGPPRAGWFKCEFHARCPPPGSIELPLGCPGCTCTFWSEPENLRGSLEYYYANMYENGIQV
jgi:hypothetical protein